VRDLGERLIVASVQETIDSGRAHEETGVGASRNRLQSVTLLDARAKERVFSFRDDMGQWDPKNQRPELWGIYNGRVRKGEHVRVFPLSNWTELDVWRYIAAEELEVPRIYFAHPRRVIERDGMLLADSRFVPRRADEEPFEASVRYRTVGDIAVTGAVRSEAETLEAVVAEIAATRVTERGETRADDRVSAAAMEDRKREGYF
jgi:sulfate adenylyltransferase subunit 2